MEMTSTKAALVESRDFSDSVTATIPAITLAFDRDELKRVLIEPEVEAHGLREKALILTVATAAAVGGASTAAAAVHDESGLTARGITPSYVAVHDEASLAQRGIDPVSLVSSHGDAGCPRHRADGCGDARRGEACVAWDRAGNAAGDARRSDAGGSRDRARDSGRRRRLGTRRPDRRRDHSRGRRRGPRRPRLAHHGRGLRGQAAAERAPSVMAS